MEGKQIEQKIYPVTTKDYQLLEEIGHGTSATVYSAMCLPYKEVVAIKALDLEKCKDDLDVVRREAMTMILINHPNLVKAFCSFVVEQKLWVVMPYMAGGSCLHIMRSAFPDGFNEHVIATFLKEALKALEYLHGNGYIHRDVKAGNILVDGNGIVKLADFGVSACLFETGDRQRSRNTFVGTPCWMAPEVMEQVHGYNSSADIWSFGITAMELAHGHPPFSSFPPAKIMLMTIKNTPPRLDHDGDKVRFSKSFKEMIAMCLVKDPTKRPSAKKLLKHPFFKQAHKIDYIRQHILDGLPSLGEQYKKLKNVNLVRHAQQNTSFDEKNEKSQIEYKRGVSNWIFDVDDLKAQAAQIPDDTLHETMKEGDDTLHKTITKDGDETLQQTTKDGDEILQQTTKDGDGILQQAIKGGEGILQQRTKGGDQILQQTIKEGDGTLHQDEFAKSTLHIHTQEHMDFECPNCIQLLKLYFQKTLSSTNLNGASIPVVAIVPHLKDALEYAIMQKDALEDILRNINPSGVPTSIDSHGGSKQNSNDNALNDDSSVKMVEIQSERERDYLQQIEELQGKFSKLQEGLQILKERNIILEQQLNAICNKKEEKRM